MKNNVLFFFLMSLGIIQAQIPNGYYDDAQGLTGYTLKTKLSEITGQGYISHSYGDLWQAYETTDVDLYYESDGTVLDVYSENPDGVDPYEYTFTSDQCGNYSEEGDCYNREHLVPQSWFNQQYPMKADIHHIYPADGYVNGIRSNFPFGEVGNANYVSENNSKRGNNVYDYPGAYTGTVFEPIDEFKGDIARVYFYMAMRYENQIGSWANASSTSAATFNGTSDQVFTDWMLDMLLKWNDEDPVSQREIDRNNAAYDFQGNRNPFIDHPEYVQMIWGSSNGGEPDNDTVLFEDFNDCQTVSQSFIAVSEMSDENWHCITNHGQDDTGAMQMNGFSEGQQVPSIDWLITTNPINFDDYTDEKLSFYAEATFGNTALQLLYSEDYEGNGFPSSFTWQPVPNLAIPLYPQGESDPVQNIFSDVDISSIQGTQVYLGFKYNNSNGEAATRWTLDNFTIEGKEVLSVNQIKDNKFSLYPNPVSGQNFTIEGAQIESFTYRIYDLNGRLIRQGSSQSHRAKVSVSGIQSGLYLVTISSEKQTSTKRLIVK